MPKVVPEWLTVAVTPARLAPGTMAAAELEQLSEQQTKDLGLHLDDDVRKDLARSGWLRQDVHCRGSYLSTVGLDERRCHPELVILNVPSGAEGWAAELLNEMAEYLDVTKRIFVPGDIYVREAESSDGVFTFDELTAEGAESIGFTYREHGFLVVIPLP